MPVIAMSRPWLRPHDGKFYLRKRTPTRYRAVAGRDEFRIPLNTRDPKEARARMPQALATWAEMEEQWEREISAVRLNEEGAKGVVRCWLTHLRHHGDPTTFGFVGSLDISSVPEVDLTDADVFSTLTLRHAKEAVQVYGVGVAEESVGLVIRALEPWIHTVYSAGFWLDVAAERGLAIPRMQKDPVIRALIGISEPPPTPNGAQSPGPGAPPRDHSDTPVITFDNIWEAWSTVTTIAPRTVHETKGILKQLAVFLGHDNAAKVTKADLIRWRDSLKAGGKSNATWNNRLSLIGQVFKRAVKNDVLPVDPTVGLRLDKGTPNHWQPYSDEDTVAILQAARKETSPALRWAHWVMALSGMRVGEVLQLTGNDITKDAKSGVWFMAVKHALDEGKSAKNSKPRNVPLHPSLVQEGFLAYALDLKARHGDVSLFPDKKPDKYGRLGGRAWNLVGKWVREKVGITDRKKAPDHSWRHRMEDELRIVEVDESIRDAIIGHARKTVGANYGVRGEALARLHRELSKVKLPDKL